MKRNGQGNPKRRFYRARRLLVTLCVLVCFMAGLSACQRSGGAAVERRDFAYADGGFSVSLRGTVTRLGGSSEKGGNTLPQASASAETSAALTAPGVGHTTVGEAMPLAADVAVGAPRPTGERDMAMTFSSPAALAGTQVARRYETGTDGALFCRVTVTTATGVTLDDRAAPGTYDALLRFAEALLPQGDVVEVSPVRDGARTVTCRTPDANRTAAFTFSEAGGLPVTVRVQTAAEVLDLTVTERG